MNWCKLTDHNWKYYIDNVPHIMSNGYKFMVNTEFRFCAKCYTNQIRAHHTSNNDVDWVNCELRIDQLRDKKLNELGI